MVSELDTSVSYSDTGSVVSIAGPPTCRLNSHCFRGVGGGGMGYFSFFRLAGIVIVLRGGMWERGCFFSELLPHLM